MTAPHLSPGEQAVRLTDTAGKRRLTPAEHARLRDCITELAARASGPSGGTGPGTGLDASVSAELRPHAPMPARARDSHAAAQTAPTAQEPR